EADGICGAEYGEVSADRVNRRNGYRMREWDTRAGTVDLAIPKLRSGSYFPEWLLARRRRAEQALISVVATSYLLGVSTRRVDKLVEQLGVAHISKSQVSELAKHLDGQVEAIAAAPVETLAGVEGVGPTIARAVVDWFADPRHTDVVARIRSGGAQTTDADGEEAPRPTPTRLTPTRLTPTRPTPTRPSRRPPSSPRRPTQPPRSTRRLQPTRRAERAAGASPRAARTQASG
uniref:transposase n=1 Tax=Frankia sp. Cas3 TaxID=3073926 RepID=UPI002AD4F27C